MTTVHLAIIVSFLLGAYGLRAGAWLISQINSIETTRNLKSQEIENHAEELKNFTHIMGEIRTIEARVFGNQPALAPDFGQMRVENVKYLGDSLCGETRGVPYVLPIGSMSMRLIDEHTGPHMGFCMVQLDRAPTSNDLEQIRKFFERRRDRKIPSVPETTH